MARRITRFLKAGHPVLHISVHTFTPVLDGKPRDLEVGLLYDPAHGRERVIAKAWKDRMQELAKGWRIRMNQPYKGHLGWAYQGAPGALRGGLRRHRARSAQRPAAASSGIRDGAVGHGHLLQELQAGEGPLPP